MKAMIKRKMKNKRLNGKTKVQKNNTIKHVQQMFFRTQLILIITLALFLGFSGIVINIQFETEKRDQNLQNVAEAIAHSPILTDKNSVNENTTMVLTEYLDSLKETLDDIDVISVVGKNNVRLYHSNHELVGTTYDGTIPEFEANLKEYYTADETGPSGTQRRAYAAVYNGDGEYVGFVMAIMLMKNIRSEIIQTLFIFTLITIAAVLMELLISAELTARIKKGLLG